MANVKWDPGFTLVGEAQEGDEFVGLRGGSNVRFDFPGDGIKDSNGNYLFKYSTSGAGAVNFLEFQNNDTGLNPTLTTAGDDDNIALTISTKGTGVVSIPEQVEGLTRLTVDNVRIDGNGIVSIDTNGDLSLTPDGSGNLVLDGLNWPQADGAANTILYTDGAGQLGWTTAAFPVTPDTLNHLLRSDGSDWVETTTATIDASDVLSGLTQLNVDNLRLDANSITSQDTDGDITLEPNGAGSVNLNAEVAVVEDKLDFGSNWRLESEDVAGVTRLLTRGFAGGNEDAELALVPIGAAVASRLLLTDSPNLNNFESIELKIGNTEAALNSTAEGSGTALPLKLQYDSTDVATVAIDGRFTLNANMNANTNRLVNVVDPVDAQDAATKNYVDTTPGAAGGSDTELQFNNSGTLDGISSLTYDGTNVTSTRGLIVDGSSDEIQFRLQGHSTQTTNILEIENSAASNLLTFDNSGVLTVTGQGNFDNLRLDGNTLSATSGSLTLTASVNISADSNRITDVSDPTATQDAVTLNYFDNNPPGAGGSNTQIQYNNAGTLAGDSGFTTDGAGALVATGSFKLQADSAPLYFGAGDDATIQYNGSQLLINPQLVGSGNTIFSNGRVGIGVSIPSRKLHVKSASTLTAIVCEVSAPGMGITNISGLEITNSNATNGNWGGVLFSDTPGTAASALMGAQYINRANNYANIGIATRGVSGFTEKFTILSDGDVGVGTSSPTAKLEVNGVIKNNDDITIVGDSKALTLGAGNDATIQYDGTDLLINPQAVGSGNLVQTAGNFETAGISFNSGTDVLNNFTEGSFTAGVEDGSGNASATTATGTYKRNGNIVDVSVSLLSIDTTGLTAGDPVRITGLPYTINASNPLIKGMCPVSSTTSSTTIAHRLVLGANYFLLSRVSFNAGFTVVTVGHLTDDTSSIITEFSYFV